MKLNLPLVESASFQFCGIDAPLCLSSQKMASCLFDWAFMQGQNSASVLWALNLLLKVLPMIVMCLPCTQQTDMTLAYLSPTALRWLKSLTSKEERVDGKQEAFLGKQNISRAFFSNKKELENAFQ